MISMEVMEVSCRRLQRACFDLTGHAHGCQEDQHDDGKDQGARHIGLELGAGCGGAQRLLHITDQRLLSGGFLDISVDGSKRKVCRDHVIWIGKVAAKRDLGGYGTVAAFQFLERL